MFTDTDDYLKYTFFAQDVYLFNVKVEPSKPAAVLTKAHDISAYRDLVRRITARRVLKRGMKL
jgi:hypothetical protein